MMVLTMEVERKESINAYLTRLFLTRTWVGGERIQGLRVLLSPPPPDLRVLFLSLSRRLSPHSDC